MDNHHKPFLQHFHRLIVLAFLITASGLQAQIKIAAVGDIMLGSVTPKTVLPPDGGKEFVDNISPLLKNNDIVFGNLEGAIIEQGMRPVKCSDESRKLGRCYEFGMPDYLAASLKRMGFTVLSQDNNHSEDYGYEGYNHSQKVLDELGIKYAPKRGYAVIKIDSLKIAVAAFGYSSSSYNISNLSEAESVIKGLNKKYDLIIVSFHGGAEGSDATHVKNENEKFLGEDRGNVYAFAHTVIDAGADLVIGHGPHVLRGMEFYKNKLIAYSLGNFLTYGNISILGVSGISAILNVKIDISTGDFIRGKVIPIEQIGRGIPVNDSRGEAIKIFQRLSNSDFPQSKLQVWNNGIIIYPSLPQPVYAGFNLSMIRNEYIFSLKQLGYVGKNPAESIE